MGKFILGLLLFTNILFAEPRVGLTIVFDNLAPKVGCLNLAMYGDAVAYNNENVDRAYIALKQQVEQTTMEIFIPNLKPGAYGIQAFQDKDCTGRMKKGWFGIPKYAYGFSNNTRSRSFSKAKFQYDKRHNQQIIALKKFTL